MFLKRRTGVGGIGASLMHPTWNQTFWCKGRVGGPSHQLSSCQGCFTISPGTVWWHHVCSHRTAAITTTQDASSSKLETSPERLTVPSPASAPGTTLPLPVPTNLTALGTLPSLPL